MIAHFPFLPGSPNIYTIPYINLFNIDQAITMSTHHQTNCQGILDAITPQFEKPALLTKTSTTTTTTTSTNSVSKTPFHNYDNNPSI